MRHKSRLTFLYSVTEGIVPHSLTIHWSSIVPLLSINEAAKDTLLLDEGIQLRANLPHRALSRSSWYAQVPCVFLAFGCKAFLHRSAMVCS